VACLQENAEFPCVDACPCFNAHQVQDWPKESQVPEELINGYSSLQPNPLRMEEVLAMKDFQATAKMLKLEIPVRLANRIAHLSHLDMMENCQALLCARARLVRSFKEVLGAADTSLEDFAEVVRTVKERHKHQVKRLTVGMKDLKRLRVEAGANEAEVIEEIDKFLDGFVLSRIGIEMLNSQYLSMFSQNTGIADPHCDPCAIARRAGRFARKIASKEFEGSVPEVDVTFHGKADARTLPLVPSYLMYILLELLKNSVRAVAEQHRASGSTNVVPTIVIRVASDDSQMVMDIFDRGGGIPFELQQRVWSYMYSTRRGSPGTVQSDAAEATPLAGFGVGLPLSRLYAEYIGGSLQLVSMPNFGTHAFLFLERCSSRKEGMPTYVNWLRKRHLLEELLDLEGRKRAAVEVEDYAEALRLKGLCAEVHQKLKEFHS